MKKYIVTMIIDTDDGYPSNWDWGDLLDGGGKHNVSHVMSHRIYPFPVSSQDRERYDIPHVDEIQQAFVETDEEYGRRVSAILEEEAEREYEMRDEVYPDDNI